MRCAECCAALLLSAFAYADSTNTLGTAAGLYSAMYSSEAARGRRFDLQVRILAPKFDIVGGSMSVEDESGAIIVNTQNSHSANAVKSGDMVHLQGEIARDSKGNFFAKANLCEITGHGPTAIPIEIEKGRYNAGHYDCRLIRGTGTVIDSFTDEIDPNFIFYILNCNGERITVATESIGKSGSDCERSINCKLSFTGVCRPCESGTRTQLGRYVRTTPDNITIRPTPDSDPFAVPEIKTNRITSPEEITSFERRRVLGQVLAIWHGDKILIRSQKGKLVSVSVAFGGLPACGEMIEVSGFPDTDLYQVNLSRSVWRSLGKRIVQQDEILPVSVSSLLTDDHGRHRFNSSYHGHLVRIRGRIRNMPLADGENARILLENDNCIIPIDISARPEDVPGLKIDSLIEVTGICIMDMEIRSQSHPFPHVKEMFIAIRTSDDIRIIADPPWWTPGKLLAIIGGLFLITCGSLVWNLSLKRIVNTKSRELKSEITAHLESELKSRERTRLAVELHDSIAQTLSGTAMEIGSAIRFATDDTAEMLKHLELASQSLHSCRDELRDCMWDLRSKALEYADMNDAIKTTLIPYVSNVTLLVRFNVPREKFSDSTAHAILRIIRELTLNAVRHGHADTIRIAGSLDGPRLLFSVHDNGSGFDPNIRPGVAQGHFGLAGVRERINRFGGEIKIASSPGHGAKVTLSMDVVQPHEEDLTIL